MTNKLYYGDNLGILREHIGDESVDLVYLDPPFNSNATYNVLFRSPEGKESPAQIEAFDDTWHWGENAEDAYWQVLNGPNTDAASLLKAMRDFLGQNDMMAYLAMMAVRLIELHRVLKKSGSLYLHCDPTASHYLKILLDAIFGPRNFKNEITWKRQSAHSDAKYKFSDVSDTILLYGKSHGALFRPQYGEHDADYIAKFYRFDDNDGRGPYRLGDMASPNPRPKMMYEWLGFAWPEKGWRYQRDTMQRLHDEGRIFYPLRSDGALDTKKRPALKRYLAEQEGSIITDFWTDINPLHSAHAERLGYPTQKPVALLERIISASSNEGDLVLDPFCGCGTTVHAAQKLNRRWIGIDVTHLAIGLIERRLRDAFGKEAKFETIGVPKDVGAAEALSAKDKHEFEKWAISLIPDARPFRGGKKGSDTGIDGILYLKTGQRETEKAIIEVKGGAVSVDQIHKLKSVIEREKALLGIFLTLRRPTRDMTKEAAAAGFAETAHGRIPRIQILTIDEILTFKKTLRLPVVDSSAFKKAKREEKADQRKLDL